MLHIQTQIIFNSHSLPLTSLTQHSRDRHMTPLAHINRLPATQKLRVCDQIMPEGCGHSPSAQLPPTSQDSSNGVENTLVLLCSLIIKLRGTTTTLEHGI